MEDVFYELHYEFINSEDFIVYLKELNEYSNKVEE